MKYVYEIVNTLGTVEYVGETVNIENRFKQHTKKKTGKFFGRNDLSINAVAEFLTKKEAYSYQIELQKSYGLKTDKDHCAEIARKNRETLDWSSIARLGSLAIDKSIGGEFACKLERTCECGRTIKGPGYFNHIKKCNSRGRI